jgi:hypothetical protein
MSFKISKFFLYASVFCVAIVSTSTLFPFIVGKYAWFRTSVDLSLIFFLFGLLGEVGSGHHWERLKKVFASPVGIAVGVFALMFLLAGAFGVSPANSFWSNFERGEGGFQILHLYLFFILLTTLFNEEKDWHKLFKCVFGAALLSIGYGLLAGWEVNNLIGPVIGPVFGTPNFRFQGSIGNSSYMATYLVFVLFYAAYLFFSEVKKGFKSPKTLALVGLIMIFGTFLFLAATRGAFVGLVASTLVFLGYVAFTSQRYRRWVLGLGLVLVLFVGTMIALKNNPEVQKLPFARVFDISINAQTFSDRTEIWKMAWDGFKERPLLGVGPENFLYVFDHNFNPAYFKPPAAFGAWFDRAHNIVLDYLAEIGLLGTLAYLSIFGIFYVEFFRKARRKEERGTSSRLALMPTATRALIFALPVAYLVQGMVLFDILPTYLNVFLLFAFAAYLFSPSQPHFSGGVIKQDRESPKIFLSVLGIVLAIFMIIYGSVLPVLKSQAYIDASRNMSGVNTVQGLEDDFNVVFNMYSPIGGEESAKFLESNIIAVVSGQSGQKEAITRALINYIEPKIYPDTRHYLAMASMYMVALTGFKLESDYDKAVGYYLRARVFGPKLPPVLYGLLTLYNAKGDKTGVHEVGGTILKYWPQDTRVSDLLKGAK